MKTTGVLLLVLVFCAGITFAQPKKGMMELSLSGPVFQKNSNHGNVVAPAGFLGYFLSPKLELGGKLGLLSYSTSNDNNGGNVGIECAYHFSAKEKTWTYASLGFVNYFGEIYGENLNQIKADVGVKYWPMPGGAVNLNGFIIRQFSDGVEDSIFGIDVGILIRVK